MNINEERNQMIDTYSTTTMAHAMEQTEKFDTYSTTTMAHATRHAIMNELKCNMTLAVCYADKFQKCLNKHHFRYSYPK